MADLTVSTLMFAFILPDPPILTLNSSPFRVFNALILPEPPKEREEISSIATLTSIFLVVRILY